MKIHIADQKFLQEILNLSFCKNVFKIAAETGNSGLSVFRSPRLEACSAVMFQGFGVPDELGGPNVTPTARRFQNISLHQASHIAGQLVLLKGKTEHHLLFLSVVLSPDQQDSQLLMGSLSWCKWPDILKNNINDAFGRAPAWLSW